MSIAETQEELKLRIKKHNNRNKGRCGRCWYSNKSREGLLYCSVYGSDCVRVARNCKAPPEGYKLNPEKKDG